MTRWQKSLAGISLLFATCVAAIFLCGCSSTKFTPYHESTVIQGQGGTMEDVDGIDLWEKGEPGGKYKILGVLQENHKRLPIPGPINGFLSEFRDEEAEIASAARKQGGDAVILLHQEADPVGVESNGGKRGKHPAKFVVIKYQ